MQLEEAEERERAILGTVIWPRQNRNTRRRRWWVRELQRESQGDFVSFLRIDPAMFHELLVRVGPRITKVQRYVHQYNVSDTNLPYCFVQFT